MRAFSCLLLCAALAGCGTAPATVARITVVADPAANQNSATALDIVFVYDSNLVPRLPRSSADWFGMKDDLTASYPGVIEVVAMELAPSMVATPALPPRHSKAIGVYSYANYISPKGQAMGTLTPFKEITIRLLPDTVVYSGK